MRGYNGLSGKKGKHCHWSSSGIKASKIQICIWS